MRGGGDGGRAKLSRVGRPRPDPSESGRRATQKPSHTIYHFFGHDSRQSRDDRQGRYRETGQTRQIRDNQPKFKQTRPRQEKTRQEYMRAGITPLKTLTLFATSGLVSGTVPQGHALAESVAPAKILPSQTEGRRAAPVRAECRM
jgi:hypothetical protein